jgi:tight adherence protein C
MNAITIIIIVAVIIGAVALGLVFVARRIPKDEEDPLQARLAEFTERGEQVSLEEIEMSQPFTERVLYPMMRKFGEISSKFTPQKVLQDTTTKLELAGNPGRIDASTFYSGRFIVAGLVGVIAFLLFTFSIMQQPFTRAILYTGIAVVIGFFFPQLWLNGEISKRQKSIRKAMPDALDLLTICVEAGLGFDAAMQKVAEKWENELSMAFGRVIREIQLGKIRREALRDMAERIGIAEMTSFVAAVIQSETLGVSMAKVLRIQSDQMRMKRRQRAEEEAHQAPIKMLIPMVAFIFPSIFIVLMTPAAIRFMDSGFMKGF